MLTEKFNKRSGVQQDRSFFNAATPGRRDAGTPREINTVLVLVCLCYELRARMGCGRHRETGRTVDFNVDYLMKRAKRVIVKF